MKAETYTTWADIKEMHMAVFNDQNVRIVKVEHFEGQFVKDKFREIEGSRKLVAEYK